MDAKRIVFATDFSHSSDAALEYATVIARESGGTLMIVHAEEPPMNYGEGGMYYGAVEPDIDELRRMLEAVRPTDPAVKFEHHLIRGQNPAAEVVRFAKERDADLIVLGTHGRTGVKRLLMGSVAEAVLRRAPCPVLVVRQRSGKVATAK